MRFFWNCLCALSAITGMALFADRTAVADTYSTEYLAIGNANGPVGIYADSSVLIHFGFCAEEAGNACYRHYQDGPTTSSLTEPNIPFDNGINCAVSFSGFQEYGRCNGNYDVFSFSISDPLSQQLKPGIYAGEVGGWQSLIYSSSFPGLTALDLNQQGSVLFESGTAESIYEAYNTTPAPEPGSMVLLVTGLAAGVLVQRRVLG